MRITEHVTSRVPSGAGGRAPPGSSAIRPGVWGAPGTRSSSVPSTPHLPVSASPVMGQPLSPPNDQGNATNSSRPTTLPNRPGRSCPHVRPPPSTARRMVCPDQLKLGAGKAGTWQMGTTPGRWPPSPRRCLNYSLQSAVTPMISGTPDSAPATPRAPPLPPTAPWACKNHPPTPRRHCGSSRSSLQVHAE